MADKKISELPVASGIAADDISVLVGSDADYQYSFTTLLDFIGANLPLGAKMTFGTTLPQNTAGNNGDIFLKTDTATFYQKVNGMWISAYTISTGNGADGTLLYGMGIPGSTTGSDNDSYIDTTTGIFYLRTSGAWNQVFSMATGPQGPPGIAGTNGINGTNGNTILSGNTDPSNLTDGVNGDYYINLSTYYFFGPKANGIWPAGISIVGPTGTDGTNGINGTNGNSILNGTSAPDNSLGNNGDFYLDTANYNLYGPKTSGAWPAGIAIIGANGTNGVGIPAGGTAGQVLIKINETDYNTEWGNVSGISYSGTSTQFIKGDGSYASLVAADVTSALEYTPYNSANPNGYISSVTGTMITTALGYMPFANPMSSTGDIIIGGASGMVNRLAAGSNGDVLTMVGGVPAWAATTGGSGMPAGSNTQLQYNNAGVFGASASLSWNNANGELTVGTGTSTGYLLLAASGYGTPSRIYSRGSGIAIDLDGTGAYMQYWDNNSYGLQVNNITCNGTLTAGYFASGNLNIVGRERYVLSSGGAVYWYNGMGNGGGLSSTDWSFTNGGLPFLAIKNSNGNILINSGTDDGLNKLQVTGSVAITAMNSSISGSTNGSASFSQPFCGSFYKKVIIQLINLNGTASYTFPAAFAYVAKVTTGNGALVTSLSITSVTVTGATTNDTIILEGY